MPIIDIPVDQLTALLNRGQPAGKSLLSEQELAALLPKIGCALEEIAQMHQFACRRCDKIFDRTEAQGRPLQCTQCGSDFRRQPELLGDMGPNRVFRFDLLAVRADIFDAGGMARLLRGYLGVQPGLMHYELTPATITVQVDPQLFEETSRRPYIACAVVRGAALDHALIKMLMNLQEDLHWALGRDRKLASIGVYDLDTLRGTQFQYRAVTPDGVRFAPLGGADGALLTPAEILEQHATGREYGHLLRHMRAYPLLTDEAGAVLSLPPIINSEPTRVTLRSTNLFIDVTGLSPRVVERALNILTTSLKEHMPQVKLERVKIAGPAGRQETPDFKPAAMALGVTAAAETIGAALEQPQLAQLLMRMGHGVDGGRAGDGLLTVHIPAYRNDILHPIDLIEDAAVAFGYENLTPALVPTFTVGGPRLIEEQAALARRAFTGMGFHQVMTLVLTSAAAAFEKWRYDAQQQAALRRECVLIENPISVEQTMARRSLLPGLLETLALNKQYDLPQQIFEVGDISRVDAAAETGAREERYAAAALIGTHTGYADARAVCDAFMREFGLTGGKEYELRPLEDGRFIAGRAAALHDRRGEAIGVLGEVHPEVLENYGLRHAVAVMEWSLARLLST